MIGISRLTSLRRKSGIRLSNGASAQKVCRVVVFNGDGSVNREFTLTTAQYHALAQPGAGAPQGVNDGERWLATGHDFATGDAKEESDGSLLVKTGEIASGGRTFCQVLKFLSGEWSGAATTATATAAALASLPANRRPLSFTNGVIVL